MKLKVHRKNSHSNKLCPVCSAPYLLAESVGVNREFYDWYINHSPVWYAIKKWARERANNKCEKCGNQATEVHHKSYINLGKEQPQDIIVLCRNCHEKEHGIGDRWTYDS